MVTSRLSAALGVALLLAGCGTAPATTGAAAPVDSVQVPSYVLVAEQAAPDEFGLLTVAASLGIASVCASSTFNAYFPASHVTDGNSHTAWQPACSDSCPSLTFELCSTSCVDGMTIKQSGADTRIDVWVWDGRCWNQAACDLKPTAATATCFKWCGVDGCRVRLDFKNCKGGNLFVCDTTFGGHCVVVRQPEPTPTPVPSVEPTLVPIS